MGKLYNKNIQVLIDSGASENYVSPHVIQNEQELIPVFDRKVETAGGEVAEIKYKVNLKVDLNGYSSTITAYVFPIKFDLILGRSWLKQENPTTNWDTDIWSINQGSTLLKPQKNTYHNHSPLTSISDLSYLISHKQADRFLKKGANGFLLCIRDVKPQNDMATNNTD
ncbi:hypothetical protein INT47_007743 [Mucor saturninus]|uniref:Retropepsins domain-containing protein n=1 Tax=Mucor saturninus TaxID=64648 RepID=A0A8H7RDS7_9FUNG|nr:hypothetical protein INT47_007743 [Mucor saturninus]